MMFLLTWLETGCGLIKVKAYLLDSIHMTRKLAFALMGSHSIKGLTAYRDFLHLTTNQGYVTTEDAPQCRLVEVRT